MMAGVANVAGIDSGLCAIEGDKRWMMRVSWLRLSTRRKGVGVEPQGSGIGEWQSRERIKRAVDDGSKIRGSFVCIP